MSGDMVKGIELLLILAAVLGWGFWELWKLKKGR
jgi:hypothetical protein